MESEQQTVDEYLAELNWITSQEIESEEHAQRIIRACKMEEMINEAVVDAIRLGCPTPGRLTIFELISFVDIRKEAVEQQKKENGPAVHTSPDPQKDEPEDPTDARIWKIVNEDPNQTDTQIGQKIGLGRQAVNTRRKALEKMGYKVR